MAKPANNFLTHGGGVARALEDRYPDEMNAHREAHQVPLPDGCYSLETGDVNEVLNVVYTPNAGWSWEEQVRYLEAVLAMAFRAATRYHVVTTPFGNGLFRFSTSAAVTAMRNAVADSGKAVTLLLRDLGVWESHEQVSRKEKNQQGTHGETPREEHLRCLTTE